MINDEDIKYLLDDPVNAKDLLLKRFDLFVQVFHFYMEREQFIIMPFHKEIIAKLMSYVYGYNEKQNLYIGISPRSGKSKLCIYFMAWAYAMNPFSNFIYTSYSGDLCVKHSKMVRNIVTSDLFKALFGIVIDSNTSASDLWRINGGGEFRAVPLGGAITGFGCFGGNTIVKTNKGDIKIKDIVRKKMPVKVYSWGSKGVELVPIINYVEFDEGANLEIRCGKERIKATKDHKFMTDNGWKKAEDLVVGDWVFSPNSFNHICRTIKCLCKGFYGIFSIDNIRNLVFRKKFLVNRGVVSGSLKSDARSFSRPLCTSFNIRNLPVRERKVDSNKFIGSGVCGNFVSRFGSNFGVSVMSTMFNAILFVVRLCPIRKVRDRIISFIAVKMPNNKVVRFAKKSQSDQFVDSKVFGSTKFDREIALVVSPRFKNLVGFLGKYFPRLRDVVVRMVGYRIINSVIKCNHSKKSFCLSTKNHNFLLGKSQVCVHNCGTFQDQFGGAIIVDDFLKADNYKSKAEKQNVIDIFENTLRSRKNRPAKDPTIIIAQRLAKDDLIDYIREKYPDEWDFFVIPALDEQKDVSFWEDRYPVSMLKRMKEENPFLFYSQYQQAPIAMGGGIIKHSWWCYYKDIEDTRYRRIFITADTAVKTKEWNDFTAIGCWGVTIGNKLRLLDMVHGKFEIPELQSTMLAFWDKWHDGIGNCRCTEIIIEDKASGMQLIQQLKRVGGMPIRPITPEKDKLSRVYDVIPQIAAGNVELPESENHKISREFLAESDSFSADDSHEHDDMVDMAVYAIDKAFVKKGYF